MRRRSRKGRREGRKRREREIVEKKGWKVSKVE